MLDPGASTFLCCCGPMSRYSQNLRQLGYPTDDHPEDAWNGIGLRLWAHSLRWWSLDPGLDGLARQIYLLPLSMDCEMKSIPHGLGTRFWLAAVAFTPGEVDVNPRSFSEFNGQEMIMQSRQEPDVQPGTCASFRNISTKRWMSSWLELNKAHGHVSSGLREDQPGRVIWEQPVANSLKLLNLFNPLSKSSPMTPAGILTCLLIDELHWNYTWSGTAWRGLHVPIKCGPCMKNHAELGCKEPRATAISALREWHHQVHRTFARKSYLFAPSGEWKSRSHTMRL